MKHNALAALFSNLIKIITELLIVAKLILLNRFNMGTI
jgi:hypothetical protein